MKDLLEVIEERIVSVDDMQKVGDHYWGGDYEPSYLELERLSVSMNEILVPKLTKAILTNQIERMRGNMEERAGDTLTGGLENVHNAGWNGGHNQALQTQIDYLEDTLSKLV